MSENIPKLGVEDKYKRKFPSVSFTYFIFERFFRQEKHVQNTEMVEKCFYYT